MAHVVDSTAGCKVLPVIDEDDGGAPGTKTDRRKDFLARVSELLKRAVTAKKCKRDASEDDEQVQPSDGTSMKSSTTSSVGSPGPSPRNMSARFSPMSPQVAVRMAQWITTDSDFVVLEL